MIPFSLAYWVSLTISYGHDEILIRNTFSSLCNFYISLKVNLVDFHTNICFLHLYND